MKWAFLFILIVALAYPLFSETIIRPYAGFTLWIDTEKRAPFFFLYTLGPDLGNYDERTYKFDDWIPDEYEQTSKKTYNSVQNGWDLGHLVPLNHLDSTLETAEATEYLLNIMPQAREMNRWGTWRQTEDICECLRESHVLTIMGGVVWGDNTENDYFVESHGIETPDYFWKSIIYDDQIIAWLMPNTNDKALAGKEALDKCLKTINEIDAVADIPVYIPEFLRSVKPATSWEITCSGGNWGQ